ncbi:MAG: hypothetical protein ABSH47_20135 [Bryobacteraceae bacterium]
MPLTEARLVFIRGVVICLDAVVSLQGHAAKAAFGGTGRGRGCRRMSMGSGRRTPGWLAQLARGCKYP